MLIWSEVDNNWMAVFDSNGVDFTEGNVFNDQALNTTGIIDGVVTGNSITADGRFVPQPSANIVYGTNGGGGSSGTSGSSGSSDSKGSSGTSGTGGSSGIDLGGG